MVLFLKPRTYKSPKRISLHVYSFNHYENEQTIQCRQLQAAMPSSLYIFLKLFLLVCEIGWENEHIFYKHVKTLWGYDKKCQVFNHSKNQSLKLDMDKQEISNHSIGECINYKFLTWPCFTWITRLKFYSMG